MRRRPGFFQKEDRMEGDESARIIGAIEASQAHTETSLKALREEHGKLRDKITKNHLETTKGFGEIEKRVAVFDQKLDSHIEVCEDPPKKRKGAKATGIAGLGAGVVILGERLWEKISGG